MSLNVIVGHPQMKKANYGVLVALTPVASWGWSAEMCVYSVHISAESHDGSDGKKNREVFCVFGVNQ